METSMKASPWLAGALLAFVFSGCFIGFEDPTLTLSQSSVSVEKGKTTSVTATALRFDGTADTIQAVTSNSAVAEVSVNLSTITVTGVAEGTAVITITSGSGQSTTLSVTVTPVFGTGKWKYSVGSDIASAPALANDGTIYVKSWNGKLYAIGSDGTLQWELDTGVTVSSPTLSEDDIVYVGGSSQFYAVSVTGSVTWSYQVGGDIDATAAIASDGTIYVGSNDMKLYAINSDGTLKWSYTTGGAVCSSAAIAIDGTVYFGSEDNKVYALDSDGTSKWSYTTGGAVCSSPAIGTDGTIYVGSDDNKLYALTFGGTVKWYYVTSDAIRSSPTIGADGTIYVGSLDGSLYALNADGTLKWSFATEGAVYSSPSICSDGTIYIGSDDYNVYAVTQTGTLRWKYTTDGAVRSAPVIGSNGSVYVGSQDGNLHVINGSGRLADTPWPMFGRNPEHSANTLAGGLDIATLIIEETSVSVTVSNTVSLNSLALTAAGEFDTISASSSDTGIATVSVSESTISITGVAEGSTTITVTSGSGETATCTVTVLGSASSNSRELTFFSEQTDNRFRDTHKQISGDGTKMVVIKEAEWIDLSLSGWLGNARDYPLDDDSAEKVYLYDLVTDSMDLLYTGTYADYPSGVQYLTKSIQNRFTADINHDGSKVVIAYLDRTMTDDRKTLTNLHKIAVIDTTTKAITLVASMNAGGLDDSLIPIRIDANASKAVFMRKPAAASPTSLWGVAYYEKTAYRLFSINLASGATAAQLSEGTGEGDNAVSGSVWNFDISDDGNLVVFHYYGDGRVMGISSDGNTSQLIATTRKPYSGGYVSISGDGSTVAYMDWGDDGWASSDDYIYSNSINGGMQSEALAGGYWQPGAIILNQSGSGLIFSTALGRDVQGPTYFLQLSAESEPMLLEDAPGIIHSASSTLGKAIVQTHGEKNVYLVTLTIP